MIEIDDNAAGFGWFIDTTPEDDDEFSSGSQLSTLDSRLRMDLLTAVMHELGHQLGWDHAEDSDDLLFETLAVGQRKRISAQDVDAWFSRFE